MALTCTIHQPKRETPLARRLAFLNSMVHAACRCPAPCICILTGIVTFGQSEVPRCGGAGTMTGANSEGSCAVNRQTRLAPTTCPPTLSI